MNRFSYKTKSANEKIVDRKWYIVDATDQTVGRLSSQVASILRGKNKPYYTPHFDTGDYVIIINSSKVKFSGNKMKDKKYLWYTGYPGGQREITPEKLLQRRPNAVMEKAVKGMLPKNKLGRAMYKKLFVYEGTDHPHSAQKPETLNLNNKKTK